METFHCLKTVRIRRLSAPCFSAFGLNTPHLSVFSSNAGKYGPEKLQIGTLFQQFWSGMGYYQKICKRTPVKEFFGKSKVQSVDLHLFYEQIASHVIRREFY